ncbi:uncharacterized protein [Nicotiana tomentosiformis]|uniref:uncharacterized protein n=1 Tax=Nicotiana tomentosiformis TaxID=4098 RepID=UPI00388CC079
MAEYEVYIVGLRLAIDMNIQELLVIGDSDLLVHQNEFADTLATLSSMIQHPDNTFIDPTPIGIHKQATYCAHVEEEIDENPWFHDNKKYLEKGEYPESANPHSEAHTSKIGQLFLSKRRNSIHADMIRVPPNELNAINSLWPLSAWGMDVIGPIKPATSNRHRFILVAIDYFTKWVEAASYKAVTKKVVADFVRGRIVCRFGVPESIITDNVANLNIDLMKAMCETFKIKHRNSTAYKP